MADPQDFRFSVPGADVLQSLSAAPLPPGLRETGTSTTWHRDLYFDTADGALRARSATYRLRYHADGHCVLSLRVGDSEVSFEHGSGADPASLIAGDNEPARRCRALTDPSLLRTRVELEVARTERMARGGWLRLDRLTFSYDDVTVRQGELTRSFQELRVRRLSGSERVLEGAARALVDRHALRPSPVSRLDRAEAIRARLEDEARTYELGAGRFIAVLAIDADAVAVLRDGDRVRFPTGAGAGEEACRLVMQAALRTRVGDAVLAGTAVTPTGDRSVEVWVVRRVRRVPALVSPDLAWISAAGLAALADKAAFGDSESLAAYRVAAASGLLAGAAARAPAASAEAAGEPDTSAPDDFLDGSASELAFIARVLAAGADPRVPILERLRYLAIVSSNLDEFYMSSAGARRQAPAVAQLLERQRVAFASCLDALAGHGIRLRDWGDLDDVAQDALREQFATDILPLLTPRAITVSPGHPFPLVPPLTLAFAVVLGEGEGPAHYAYIRMPAGLPRFLEVPGGFLPIEQLIGAEIGRVYPERPVREAWLFRVTRLSDLDIDEARSGDLLQAIEEDLDRRRSNPVVRVEVEAGMPPRVLEILLRELRFEGHAVTAGAQQPEIQRIPDLLALGDVRELAETPVPGGDFPPFEPRNPFRAEHAIWDQLRSGDRLVHHPYDDFNATVVRFISDAADDPDVVGIRLTLYRAGERSPLVDALQRAARAGRDVAVFVELKARLDEARNVLWVKRLEAAGVHVVYGLVGLKNHSKVALVIRREADGLRRYVHIGTGNYNAGTARVYTDLGLFSADPALGEDVHDLFNQLTGASAPPRSTFRKLLVAPAHLLPGLVARIEREAQHAREGRGGRIRLKLNGLAEPVVVRKLYEASQAGVEIDLLVRGICTLRPGVAGRSDRIRVRSLLGRFLEHARIYHFGNGGDSEYFIASADWRQRNLRQRVEVAAPVTDPGCRKYLDAVLTMELADPTAWHLGADGVYAPPSAAIGDPRSTQYVLSKRSP